MLLCYVVSGKEVCQLRFMYTVFWYEEEALLQVVESWTGVIIYLPVSSKLFLFVCLVVCIHLSLGLQTQ